MIKNKFGEMEEDLRNFDDLEQYKYTVFTSKINLFSKLFPWQ